MRISTVQMQTQGLNSMQERTNDLARSQLEISTGLRILTPSDDPIGATTVIPLKDFVSQHEQYSKNANIAETRLQLEEVALESFTNILHRVHELAVQGNNDTYGNTDRNAIATEIRQNLSSLVQLANTQDSNGEYIFAGDLVRTAPIIEAPTGTFAYVGDTGQRNIQVGAKRQVAVGDPGDATFMNIAIVAGGTQSVFETIDGFITNMQAGNANPTFLTDIQTAMDRIVETRSQVGTRLNTIDSQRNLNEAFVLSSRERISEIEDLDFTEAISRMNLQLVSLQASQQVFLRIQNLSLFNYL